MSAVALSLLALSARAQTPPAELTPEQQAALDRALGAMLSAVTLEWRRPPGCPFELSLEGNPQRQYDGVLVLVRPAEGAELPLEARLSFALAKGEPRSYTLDPVFDLTADYTAEARLPTVDVVDMFARGKDKWTVSLTGLPACPLAGADRKAFQKFAAQLAGG